MRTQRVRGDSPRDGIFNDGRAVACRKGPIFSQKNGNYNPSARNSNSFPTRIKTPPFMGGFFYKQRGVRGLRTQRVRRIKVNQQSKYITNTFSWAIELAITKVADFIAFHIFGALLGFLDFIQYHEMLLLSSSKTPPFFSII